MPKHTGAQGMAVTTRQKGLRNRYRSGRSTYSRKNKGQRADRYGQYKDGVRVS
jgi:hypothetical protein